MALQLPLIFGAGLVFYAAIERPFMVLAGRPCLSPVSPSGIVAGS